MDPAMTTEVSAAHPALSWRSVLAGLVLGLFIFVALLALGLAVGGYSLADGLHLERSGIISATWVILSAALALFVSSYFASRITPFVSGKVGLGQGAILAATFFGFILWQATGLVGSVTASTSSLLGQVATIGAPLVTSPTITEITSTLTEDALTDLELTNDPSVVVAGLATRLIRGNTEGAISYLAQQSNLTEDEVDMRVASLNNRIVAALAAARVQSARAMQVSGLALFVMMALGLCASTLGGRLGMRANRKEPLVTAPQQPSVYFEPVFT